MTIDIHALLEKKILSQKRCYDPKWVTDILDHIII